MRTFVATTRGLHDLGRGVVAASDREIAHVTRAPDGTFWAAGGGPALLRSEDGETWRETAPAPAWDPTCVLPHPAGTLVGTAEAHLLRVEDGALRTVRSFDDAPERNSWYTPWGGPPDVRSMSVAPSERIFVNVHVGGILSSADGGATWKPTIDIDTDVHQVLAHPRDTNLVLAATALGLATSTDAGLSWRIDDDGLHAAYCRAVAIAGDTVLVSASEGPSGRASMLYRRPLDASAPFEACRKGLPDSFPDNVDTHCLATLGTIVVFATEDGRAFRSDDAGATWEQVADGLPAARAVLAVA